MHASVLDLRYKMNDVLKALERNEKVTVLYHGKVKGVLSATEQKTNKRITDHPYFNMTGSKDSVESVMDNLRGGRFNDI